jgi:gliding motility-associated-like protein
MNINAMNIPNTFTRIFIQKIFLLCIVTILSVTSLFAQAPTITSFNPVKGPVGTSVILTGSNFNAIAANNIVFFGATKATVTAVDPLGNNLTVTVPAGATYAPITVLNFDGITNLTGYSAKPFLTTFAPTKYSISNTAPDITPKVDFGTGISPLYIAIGDLNVDGKPDLVVANFGTSNSVTVFRNISTPGSITTASFAAGVSFGTGIQPINIAIGDLDGDGKPDLAVVNASTPTPGSSKVSLLRNISSGSTINFAPKIDFGTGDQPYGVAIGDLDGDGKPDIATANKGTANVSVLRNISIGSTFNFATKVDFGTGTSPASVAIGDLNNDGKPDLAVANNGTNNVSVLRNTSISGVAFTAASFAAQVAFSAGTSPNDVAIGDFDGDGKPDLATANTVSNNVSILRNTATDNAAFTAASFATQVAFGTGSGPYRIAIGDLDGDGKPDLVAANRSASNSVSVLRNNTATSGFLSFAAKADFTTGTAPAGVAIDDLDLDGKPDIATANGGNNTASVLRNAPVYTQATSIAFTSTTNTTTTANWTIGNGTSRAVFMAAANTGSPLPVDGTTYTAAPAFGSGTQIGTSGWYCVYKGTGTTVNITGLTQGTTYRVMVVDYYGAGGAEPESYLTTAATGNPTNLPIVSTTGSLAALSTTYGTASSSSTFSVSGTDIIAGILVTPPAGFEVSLDNITFTSTITVNGAGTIASTPVYIRLSHLTAAGTYSGNVVLSSSGAANINVATVSSTVSPANLTITANNTSKVYGTTISGAAGSTAFISSALQNSETIGSITIAYGTGSAVNAAAGTYAGSVTPSAATGGTFNPANYTISYTTGTLTVTQAALTITANNASKVYGTTISGATGSTAFTSSGLQNSETIGSVTIAYGTGSAANAAVGTYAGSVTPSVATGGTFNPANYSISYTAGTLTVTQAALTITATGPSKTYGTALTAGTSTTNFTAGATPNGETVTGLTLTPDAAGLSAATAAGAAYVVTPSLATGTNGFLASNYNITYVPFNGTVATASLTITATGPSKTYGTALTAGTSTTNFTAGATPNGETVTRLTLTPDAAGLSATTAAGAAYVVTPSLATGTNGFLASNYNITYVPFNGTVATASLTITATGPSKTYGTALTAGTSTTNFTAGATPNGETVTGLTLTPDAAGLSATTAAGAAYVVTPSLATGTNGFLASNYNITYVPFNGTVATASLTITATGPSKTYGTALTAGTSTTNFTAGATPNGETVTGLTLTPDAAGLSATTAAGAAYVVTPSLATGTNGFLASNYNITYVPFNGTVATASLTITATGPSKTYGTALTAGTSTTNFTAGATPNGETVTGLTLTPNAAGLSAATAAGGAYVVTPSLATGTNGFLASNYNITYVPFNGTVATASLTITATGPSKTYGTALTAGTSTTNFTAGATPNGETVTGLTLTPDAAGLSATTAAGAAYVVTPSLATGTNGFLASNYNITYVPFNGTVATASLTITATGPSKTYGTALTAGTSTTNFTAGATPNGETVTGLTLTPDAAGLSATTAAGAAYVVTPSLATGTNGFLASNYNITYVPFNGTVATASLTITATGPSKTYGTALTAGTSTTNFTAGATPNGETVTGLTLTPDAAGLSAATAAGAAYVVTPSLATGTNGFLASNYNITYVPFNGTVAMASLTITATGPSKTYGTALTAGTSTTNFTAGATPNGETVTGLTLTPDAAGLSATTAAGAGYVVTPSLATGTNGFLASNYNITYVPFNGTVAMASLTITASNATKIYGEVNPALGVTYAGFVNGDDNTSLTTQPGVTTTAVTGSPVGSYPVTASGAASANYTISYTGGTLTVTQATLTIAANNTTKTYGTANPALSVTYTGFVNGDDNTSLTTQPSITTTAVTGSPVGSYPVTASGAASANYTISYTGGTLTVTQAALTIAANNATKTYGTVNPALSVTYAGFVNGDDNTSLTTQPGVTTTAVTGSPVGSYPITSSGAASANYTISYTAGTLTVTQATLTIAANNTTKVYGTANPALSVTYTGFVNGDDNTSLTTQPGVTTTTVTGSAVGTYPVTASGAASANYTISYTDGTLTVTQATLTIAANNATKTYGTANPALSVTYAGFVNGDDNTSLTTQPGVTTTAVTGSPVGTYPVTASGAASANYTISYTDGVLTVTQATLTIAANNATKVYGTVNPSLSVTYAGFVNGDDNTSLTTQPGVTTTAVTGSAVGTYPVTASGAASANYTISYTDGTLTVTQATLTIAANNATKTYGTANPALSVAYTGFVNGDDNTSLTTQPSVTTTAVTGSPVGSYPVTASGAASANYTISYTDGTLTVTQATLTIAANNATKTYGTTNPALSVTYTGFVNGDDNTSLTTQPGVTTTAVTGSAVGSYPITASGAASANYTISYTDGTLTVTQATLTIAANNATKTYGTANPALSVTYAGFVNGDDNTSLTTQPGVTTTAVTVSAVGTYPVTASGAASANYTISYTDGTLTVTQATLTIAANNATKTYGTANPALSVTYAGFVNGDDNTSLTTQPGVTTTAVTGSPVGTYPVTASGATSANYSISYTTGTLTVTQAALTIAANNATKTYGTANPALSVTYAGFVNGDDNTSLTTQPGVTTTAVTGSPVGSYPVTASGAASANYTISYTDGTLTVTKATLTITANNATKTYGTVNPALSVTYTGFVNGDDNTSLTTQPSITTTAVTGSPVGSYPVTASGAASANYTISYTGGTLTVTQATLTITASNTTKTYGTVNPALSVTYAGFVNGDDNTSLTTQPGVTTTATTGSPVGSYPVTASGAASANYSISYTGGTLTVTQATLTITASNTTKTYGTVNPALSVTYAGFVNGDDNTSLTTQPSVTTTATTGSPVGTYPVTASGAASANYSISYTGGTLTVTQAALTITASNTTKTYGTANPALSVTYAGFVNGDDNTSLTTQPTVTTTATTSSAVGTYPVTASGAASANYTISYTGGTLTVTQAALTIIANNQSKAFNTPNPTLTASYTGFVNGDTNASLTTQPTITTTAVTGSPVGSYPITASGAASANYTISYTAGTLTVTPLLNAFLANLTISSGTLSPTFAQATTAYTASVGNAITSLTLTPTTADLTSTVKVNGVSVISGSASGSIPLVVGANVITTIVTAQNGTTTISYTATITRAPSSNAGLANLTISSGTLNPAFAPATYAYSTLVDHTISQLSITPTLADATATILVNGQPVANATQSGLINLVVGDNTINVLATAQDGVAKLTYTLIVHRAMAPSAILPNNILSPNGDGKNDTWIVKDIQSYPNNRVTVFDRAGRPVYTKNGYSNDWAGTYQGSPLAEGTYYYVIDLGIGENYIKGFVTIVRQR